MAESSDGRMPAAPAGSGDAAAPPWAQLTALLGDVARRLERLEAPAAKPVGGAGRDAVVDELHSQLQEARADLHWKILRTVLLDVVKLYDDLSRSAAAPGAAPELAGFRQDAEDVLYRQGFEPFTVEGDRFDPRRQQPTRTLPAPAPEMVGTVASRLAPGFASGQRVLRPEKVVVYAAAPSA